MKTLTTIRSKIALAGVIFALASALPGSAAVLHVPSADYPTIQAAVDKAAASGDIIQIAPGVYTNQVVIANKNLTLSGSPGAILRATPNMQQTFIPAANAAGYPLLGIFRSTNVVVAGLTFEGERLADDYTNGFLGSFDGVWFLAAGGRVEDCRITGFRGSTLASWAAGVYAVNPHVFGVAKVNVQVLQSTFADNKRSILLRGDGPWNNQPWQPELLSTTFAVDDNTIVGDGLDTNSWQWGIWIDTGAGGEVERNIVTDHDHLAPRRNRTDRLRWVS